MRIPDVDCALAFVGVFGGVVYSDALNLTVKSEELLGCKQTLLSKALRDTNHIEQVLLDDAVLEQLLHKMRVLLFERLELQVSWSGLLAIRGLLV